MKATGIVRRIDDLGRVVIPKEIRRTFDIDDGNPLEIFTNEDSIILKKYELTCIFCDETDEVIEFKGKKVCRNCIKGMAGG